MTHDQYLAYLKSYDWQRKRQQVFRFYGEECVICGSRDRLEVHHKTYVRLGQENVTDLIPLCAECHELVSKRLPIWLVWLGRIAEEVFDGIAK